jgi:O-methyltransferase domain
MGGGNGEFLRSILDLYPGIRGTVLDLPNGRPIVMGDGHGAERRSYVTGDFFDSVPSKAEVYLLCGVIHDWSDERALVILKNCRKAMARDGRVLIVETIVPEIGSPSFSKILDLNMMVMTTGRERTEAEFHDLLDAANFTITRIIPTVAPQSIVEAIPKKI